MIFKLGLVASFAAAVLAAPAKRILDDHTDDGKGILFLNTRQDQPNQDYEAQLLHNDKVSVLKRHDDDDDGLLDVHILKNRDTLHTLKRILGSDHGHDGEGNILGVGVLRRSHDLTDSGGTIDVDLLQKRGVLGIGGDGYRDSTLGLFGRGLDILGDDDDHDDDPLIGLLKRGAALGLGDTGHGARLLDVLRRGGLLSNHNDHDNTISLDVGKRGGLLNDGSPDLAHVGLKRGSIAAENDEPTNANLKRGLLTDDGHDDDNKLHVGVRGSEDYSAESIGLRVIDKRSDDEVLGLDLEVRGLGEDKADVVRRVLGLLDGDHERDNGNLKVDNPVGLKRGEEDTYDAQVAAGTCVLNGCDTGGGVIGL